MFMVVIVVTAWSKYRTTTSILMVLKEWNKYRNMYILKKIAWCKYRYAYHGGYVNNQNLQFQIHLVASSNQFLSKNKRACWEWNLICMPCSTGYNETIHVQKEKNIPLPCSNGGSFRSKKRRRHHLHALRDETQCCHRHLHALQHETVDVVEIPR